MTILSMAGIPGIAATVPGTQAPAAWQVVLCVVLPYTAVTVFLVGMCCRVLRWAWTPVPFRIPTTCGQQKTLPWIGSSSIENPSSGLGAVVRMALEVLLFRSLFRNNRAEMHKGNLVYGESKALWLGALTFHWALLMVVLRHLRLFVQPVPAFVTGLIRWDGIFQTGLPAIYLSDIALAAGLLYLLARRMRDPIMRYLSRFQDFFALVLLLSIAGTGMWMRYVARVDVVDVKRMALGLATFHPVVPAGLNTILLAHLVLVCTLAIYFPFGKLVHMGGVFLSPTRNLANNNRRKRHINPWNHPVKTHSYVEWEQEFGERMTAAGIPLNEAKE